MYPGARVAAYTMQGEEAGEALASLTTLRTVGVPSLPTAAGIAVPVSSPFLAALRALPISPGRGEQSPQKRW